MRKQQVTAQFLCASWQQDCDLTVVGKNFKFFIGAQDHDAVISRGPDTDVAVIAVSYENYPRCRAYFHTGVASRTRTIDVSKVTSALGTSVFSALIGIHTFPGCDSASSFHGKVEKKNKNKQQQKKTHFLLLLKKMNTSVPSQIWVGVSTWTSPPLKFFANVCASCMARLNFQSEMFLNINTRQLLEDFV